MSRCPNCPTVPVVSAQLATAVLREVPPDVRPIALKRALEWLVERHPGLALYEGIHGREYTNEEMDTIAVETSAAASLPCPMYTQDGGCLIGGLGPHYNRVEETGKQPYGWLPTLIARAWGLRSYRQLAVAKGIADVKIALLTRNEGFVAKGASGEIYVG